LSTSPYLIERFRRVAAEPETEFEVAILVAQVVDDQLNPASVRLAFDDLVSPLLRQHQPGPEALLKWLREQGFGTHRLTRAEVAHSNLAWVIAHRQGIPISLAVVLIEAARRCGIRSAGINFPGHFLVSLDDRVVDPLSMQFVDPTELLNDRLGVGEVQSLMQQASPRMLALRMLNNLKAMASNSHNFSQALDLVDLQIAMCESDAATHAPLVYERGELYEQLGAYSVARDAYLKCASLSSDRELRARANQRASQLDGHDETLH